MSALVEDDGGRGASTVVTSSLTGSHRFDADGARRPWYYSTIATIGCATSSR